MREVCVILAFLFSACGTAEAVVELPPVPLPVPSVPPPAPPRAVPFPDAPPVLPPSTPPPAPRGSIQTQSVYPVLDVTEWTLPNGMVVVYKHLQEAEGYMLRAIAARGWSSLAWQDSIDAARTLPRQWGSEGMLATLTADERRIDARGDDLEVLIARFALVFGDGLQPTETLQTAVDALDPLEVPAGGESDSLVPFQAVFFDPGEFTIVVVGAGDPDLAASVVGRHLTPLRALPGLDFGARSSSANSPIRLTGSGAAGIMDFALRISSRAGDDAPLHVLRGALEASLRGVGLGRLRVETDRTPWTETAWLRVVFEDSASSADQLEDAVRDALSGDALLVSRARRELLRQLRRPTPAHWLDAVTQLYREGGGRQPGRDPATLSPLHAPLSRVTDSDVFTLARRFAVSTDTALISIP